MSFTEPTRWCRDANQAVSGHRLQTTREFQVLTVMLLNALVSCSLVFGQNAPNLPLQPIGPNDLLSVSVYDAPELSGTLRVSTEGTVSIPMLTHHVVAKGLLPSALETAIGDALRQEDFILRPLVTVRILEYQSRPIRVVGAVRKPLTFQAVGDVALLDAIAQAEGLTPEAGPEILVSHPGPEGGEVTRIPTAAMMESSDSKYNVKLHGGEEVRVPEVGKIFVMGNVRHPGAFAASDASVLKILAMCEGLAPYAAKQAYIYRRTDESRNREEIAVDLKGILGRKSQDVPLLTADILYIPDNSGKRLGLAALEKVLLFGSTAGATAVVYRGVR